MERKRTKRKWLRNNQVVAVVKIAMKKALRQQRKLFIRSNVKVLGGGCDKCNALEKNVKEALSELGMTDEIDHVADFGQIAAMGVMSTPALVIDNKVVSMGKVLSKDDVIKALKKVRG